MSLATLHTVANDAGAAKLTFSFACGQRLLGTPNGLGEIASLCIRLRTLTVRLNGACAEQFLEQLLSRVGHTRRKFKLSVSFPIEIGNYFDTVSRRT